MDPSTGRDLVETLLKARYEFVNAATGALMTWWVSSVAFSATLISQVWTKRGQIKARSTVWGLFALGTALFGSIIVFGIGSTLYIARLERDTARMIDTVQSGARGDLLEFEWMYFGVIAGTSTFLVAMLVWWALLYSIRQTIMKVKLPSAPNPPSSEPDSHQCA
jgi:hypothetical protein